MSFVDVLLGFHGNPSLIISANDERRCSYDALHCSKSRPSLNDFLTQIFCPSSLQPCNMVSFLCFYFCLFYLLSSFKGCFSPLFSAGPSVLISLSSVISLYVLLVIIFTCNIIDSLHTWIYPNFKIIDKETSTRTLVTSAFFSFITSVINHVFFLDCVAGLKFKNGVKCSWREINEIFVILSKHFLALGQTQFKLAEKTFH